MLTALIDLVSFSGILYSIYPDLFAVVIAYAGLGTVCMHPQPRQGPRPYPNPNPSPNPNPNPNPEPEPEP